MAKTISQGAGIWMAVGFAIGFACVKWIRTLEVSMRTHAEKAEAFRALHEREGAFIIPNPWDIGTSRLCAHLGFEALATTSAGYAFSLGQRDYTLTRQQVLAHAA